MLRLLWLQIRVRGDAKAFCAVLLPEGGGEESCAVRERCPITVDKFPACGRLPGTVPAKLLVMILTAGSFQRHAVNLLLSRQIKTGGVTLIHVGTGRSAGFQLLLFPVNAAAHCPMAYHNIISPLDIALFHIIQGGARGIAASVAAVVVIFDALIVSNQLGGVNSGVVVQTGIPGLGIGLIFIVSTCVAPVTLVIVSVGGITIAAEEPREVVIELMLYAAPQHFIAVAVAIAVAAVRGIRLDVKPFGGLIGASSGNQRIAKPLVKGAVIGLIAVRTRAGVDLRTLSVGHGDDVHHPADRSGAVHRGARAADVFHPLDQ